jgi:hypothetical protein
MIPNILVRLPNVVEKIQGLESIYAGVILKVSTMFFSLCVLLPLISNVRLVCLAIFTNIYRPYRALREQLRVLKMELDSVKDFREATNQELDDYEDVSFIYYRFKCP